MWPGTSQVCRAMKAQSPVGRQVDRATTHHGDQWRHQHHEDGHASGGDGVRSAARRTLPLRGGADGSGVSNRRARSRGR